MTAAGQTLPFSDGLLYHLDASTGVAFDGAGVSGWADQTGNGFNFFQTNPNKQPTWVANGIGGLPSIRFDGSLVDALDGVAPNADELILSIPATAQTFVAVNRLAAGNTNLAGIWGQNDGDNGIRRASTTGWQAGTAAPGNSNDFAFGGTTRIGGSVTGSVGENVPHVLLASRPTASTYNSTSIGDYFKAGGVAPRSYKGDVSEILVFNRELNTQEQKELSVHLAAKYQASVGGLVLGVGGTGMIGEQVVAGTEARYVRIRTEASGLPADTTSTDVNRFGFHISELEVFSSLPLSTTVGSGSNLALGSSGSNFTTIVGAGGHGTDGAVINGVLDLGAAVWTRLPANSPEGNVVPGPVEGLLDLGTDRLVGTVRVWQRHDGVPERLRDFKVTVEDANHQVLQTFEYSGQVPSGMSFAEFQLDITSNFYKVGARDILALEVSPILGMGDRLWVGGDGDGILKLEPGASLAILNLDVSTTFTIGQSFDILNFGSIEGAFETISLPGGQSMWDLSQLYTTGVITVVPEPSSFAMLLGGALFFGGRLRRSKRG